MDLTGYKYPALEAFFLGGFPQGSSTHQMAYERNRGNKPKTEPDLVVVPFHTSAAENREDDRKRDESQDRRRDICLKGNPQASKKQTLDS